MEIFIPPLFEGHISLKKIITKGGGSIEISNVDDFEKQFYFEYKNIDFELIDKQIIGFLKSQLKYKKMS